MTFGEAITAIAVSYVVYARRCDSLRLLATIIQIQISSESVFAVSEAGNSTCYVVLWLHTVVRIHTP